jgi:hypothetical protein
MKTCRSRCIPVAIFAFVAILIVQCGTYFLNARTATHWLVVDHSPLSLLRLTGRIAFVY